MRYFIPLIAVMGLLCAAPSSAYAKVDIFACTPEWGALAKEIGGSHVDVYTATTAFQDVHHMRAKPSLLSAMRKADLVFCNGASLEVGWLPILLQKAGGPSVQQNTVGLLMAADHVDKLEVMNQVDRSMGDVHPEGNPHVHLNPRNILKLSDVLAQRLSRIDSANAQIYKVNLSNFKAKWVKAIASWEAMAASLKGQGVITHHRNWSYLADWLDINVIATLEPKPGLPPTTSHLEALLQTIKGQDVKAILVAPFENDDAANWLSERTDIPVLRLPYTVGGSNTAHSLENLFDETLSMLNGVSK